MTSGIDHKQKAFLQYECGDAVYTPIYEQILFHFYHIQNVFQQTASDVPSKAFYYGLVSDFFFAQFTCCRLSIEIYNRFFFQTDKNAFRATEV